MNKTTTKNTKSEPRASVKLMRCAIYTRKSTEEGLQQEFNSLDAQRESGEASVRSRQVKAGCCSASVTTAASAAATPIARP